MFLSSSQVMKWARSAGRNAAIVMNATTMTHSQGAARFAACVDPLLDLSMTVCDDFARDATRWPDVRDTAAMVSDERCAFSGGRRDRKRAAAYSPAAWKRAN